MEGHTTGMHTYHTSCYNISDEIHGNNLFTSIQICISLLNLYISQTSAPHLNAVNWAEPDLFLLLALTAIICGLAD